MLRISHFMVSPAEIEAFLQTHPKVLQAFVIGVPDPRMNEVAVAYVIPGRGSATEAELIAHCKGRIASYKVPRHVRIVETCRERRGPTATRRRRPSSASCSSLRTKSGLSGW